MIPFASDISSVNFCYDSETFGQIHKKEGTLMAFHRGKIIKYL